MARAAPPLPASFVRWSCRPAPLPPSSDGRAAPPLYLLRQMVVPRRPSASLADREKKMRLWGPLTGSEGGLRTGAGRLQCGEERKKMLISQCHSVNIQTQIGIH
jgi:hypothetical protein